MKTVLEEASQSSEIWGALTSGVVQGREPILSDFTET